MTSKEKIEYMLHKVRERARISPPGFFYVDCAPLVDIESNGGVPDGASVLISQAEQVGILEKFKNDGLLFGLNWGKGYKGAWVSLMNLDKSVDFSPYESINVAKQGEIKTQTVSGTLLINERTGFVRLNKVNNTLNPLSQEFRVILQLVKNEHNQATYLELIGEGGTGTKRRELAYVVRNVKEALGILPKEKAKNKDIISNLKGVGYRLLT